MSDVTAGFALKLQETAQLPAVGRIVVEFSILLATPAASLVPNVLTFVFPLDLPATLRYRKTAFTFNQRCGEEGSAV